MTDNTFSIRIRNGVARNPIYRFKNPLNIEISKTDQVAIVGPNGAGKSILANTLNGTYPLLFAEDAGFETGSGVDINSRMRYITFRDSYGSGDTTYYYQQRWNTTETEDSPVISEIFPQIEDQDFRNELFSLFSIDLLWNKKLISLSSGEMRKYQLAKALSSRPDLIIIDSPFIGLDRETRQLLTELLERLIKEWGLQIMLIVARNEDLAPFITHVIPVKDMECMGKMPVSEYLSLASSETLPVLSEEMKRLMHSLPESDMESEEIVRCDKVVLQYGPRKILDNQDWTVKRGEHWSLLGPNGAGKSALLSLIYADNPQSYACSIALFGRMRGTGESIWDIKKHIGYVSPEMHRSYCRHYPAIDIVASGLYDTIGLYRKASPQDRESCLAWMKIFGIDHMADLDFYNLSSGEQRMVLLARAFVKNPSLLILDEPLHGLDAANRCLVMQIISEFCKEKQKTLIIVTHYPEELPSEVDHTLTLVRHN